MARARGKGVRSEIIARIGSARAHMVAGAIALGINLTLLKHRMADEAKFAAWCKRHGLRVASAELLIRAADRFGQIDGIENTFDASALLVLAAPGAPRSAGDEALRLSRQGKFISYRRARMLLAKFGPAAEPRSSTCERS